MSIDLIYSYLNSDGKDINRLTKVFTGTTKIKEFIYDNLNRLTKYYKNDIINTSLSYDGYNPFSYLITKKNVAYYCTWERDNSLTKFGSTYYKYNYQKVRVTKRVGNITIEYFYDGNKLFGENRSNGII